MSLPLFFGGDFESHATAERVLRSLLLIDTFFTIFGFYRQQQKINCKKE